MTMTMKMNSRTPVGTLILLISFFHGSAFSLTSLTAITSLLRSPESRSNGATRRSRHHQLPSTFFPNTGRNRPRSGRRPATSLRVSSSISAATGEADRAFRLGMRLEKAGLARTASAAFHEAATLYQCFLDHDGGGGGRAALAPGGPANIFKHVTSLPAAAAADAASSPTVQTVLAYCCVRLAHLSHDALGKAA